jgi:hypothetical protein
MTVKEFFTEIRGIMREKRYRRKFLYFIPIGFFLTLLVLLPLVILLGGMSATPEQEPEVIEEEEEEVVIIPVQGDLPNLNINLFGLPVLADVSFELFSSSNQAQEIKFIYKTGEVLSGLYSSGDDYTLDLEGFGVYKVFLSCSNINILYSKDHIPIFVIAEEAESEECSFVNKTEIFANNIVIQDYYETFFTLPEIRSSKGNSYVEVNDYSRKYLLDYIGKEDSLVEVDLYSQKSIYMNPDTNYEKFIIYSPEGFPVSYILWPTIYSSQQGSKMYTVPITMENGTKVVKSYILENVGNCEPAYSVGNSLRKLSVIGEGIDGSKIYAQDILRGSDETFFQSLYDNYLSQGSVSPYTYEEFLEAIPVIYWKSPFNNIIRFINIEFNRVCTY